MFERRRGPRATACAAALAAGLVIASPVAHAQTAQPPVAPPAPRPPRRPGHLQSARSSGAPPGAAPQPGRRPPPPPGYGAPPGYGPPQGYPPGAYPPPPGYGSPAGAYPYAYPYPYGYPGYMQPVPPPRTLPYDEGQAIPPGYHVEERARRGLVIAGTVTFGSAYLISILGASSAVASDDSSSDDFAPLFIPVAGPFITLGTADGADGAAPIFILDGIAQVGGLALLIAGLAAQESLLVRNPDVATGVVPEVGLGPRSTATWRF
ncbi:MAG: hypothetical protein WKG00_08880 [Polyangiaceae bacterium]